MSQDKPKDTAIFADGIRFERPREGSPEFIKGRISLNPEKLTKFMAEHVNEKGWVNLDLKASRKTGEDGKPMLYLQLNDFKPKAKKEHGELDPKEIPF